MKKEQYPAELVPTPFNGQKYAEIKRYLLRTGQRFVDPFFPPDETSLVYPYNSRIQVDGVVWKRPKSLVPNPKMVVNGVSGDDLNQGCLANCWYVASCSALAQKEDLWRRVVPDMEEQDYYDNADRHPGIFHFRFWHYGEWIDVVVDDYLPTKHKKLYFVHSKDNNEFWSSLLEKAYAKVFGCYEALHLGSVTEALEDFTGGVAESIDLEKEQFYQLPDKRKRLFDMMSERMSKGAILGAFITPKAGAQFEKSTAEGIIMGHAYGITGVNTVDTTKLLGQQQTPGGQKPFYTLTSKVFDLVRLRNPWGHGEWTGRFSDKSPEWNSIDEASKRKIGLVFEDDGEFWMLMEDFVKHYNQMSFCHRVEGMRGTVVTTKWTVENAGGSHVYPDTFMKNPQILFDVHGEEEEVLLGMTVKTGQEQGDLRRHQLAIYVFKVEWNREYRTRHARKSLTDKMRLSFTHGERVYLRQGRYIFIPCTKRPDIHREFIARVFTTSDNKAKLLKDMPVTKLLPTMITKLTVVKGVGLVNKLAKGVRGYRLFVYAMCEYSDSKSQMVKDTMNPEWDAEFIFFRRKPLKFPVVVEVWDDMMFLGRHRMIAAELWNNEEFELNLLDKDKVEVPGHLLVRITNTKDITDH